MLEVFGDRCHIVRLPALFGTHLKKNYIYDLLWDRQDMIANIVNDLATHVLSLIPSPLSLCPGAQHQVPVV